jgi:ankyrin repeat protein
VERLLEAGTAVNTGIAKKWGTTALRAATKEAYLDIVNRLLDAGATVNTRTIPTALYSAVGSGHLDVVDRVLNAGANESVNDKLPAVIRQDGPPELIRSLSYRRCLCNVLRWPISLRQGLSWYNITNGCGLNRTRNRKYRTQKYTDAEHERRYGWSALAIAAGMGHVGITNRPLEADTTAGISVDGCNGYFALKYQPLAPPHSFGQACIEPSDWRTTPHCKKRFPLLR